MIASAIAVRYIERMFTNEKSASWFQPSDVDLQVTKIQKERK